YLLARGPGRATRWMDIDFDPSLIRIWAGCVDPQDYEQRAERALQTFGFHAITPCSETTCYYHFTAARNFCVGDAEVSKLFHEGAVRTLLQDKDVIEAQQARLAERPDRGQIDLVADQGQ